MMPPRRPPPAAPYSGLKLPMPPRGVLFTPERYPELHRFVTEREAELEKARASARPGVGSGVWVGALVGSAIMALVAGIVLAVLLRT